MHFIHCFAAVGCWLKEAKADVQCLLVMANDEARHEEARQSLLSIQQAAVERWNSVDRLRCCASDFAKEREVSSYVGYKLIKLSIHTPMFPLCIVHMHLHFTLQRMWVTSMFQGGTVQFATFINVSMTTHMTAHDVRATH